MASDYALPTGHHSHISLAPSPIIDHEEGAGHHHHHESGHTHGINGRPHEKHIHHVNSTASKHQSSMQAHLLGATASGAVSECLSGALMVLPFLASTYFKEHGQIGKAQHSVHGLEELKDEIQAASIVRPLWTGGPAFIEALVLSSAALLLTGALSTLLARSRTDKSGSILHKSLDLKGMAKSTVALVLPFYASIQLGGWRVALAFIASYTAKIGLGSAGHSSSLIASAKAQWLNCSVAGLVLMDCLVLLQSSQTADVCSGYAALMAGLLIMPSIRRSHKIKTLDQDSKAVEAMMHSTPDTFLLDTEGASFTLLVAGICLSVTSAVLSSLTSTAPSLTASAMTLRVVVVALVTAAILITKPSSLRSDKKLGFTLGASLCMISVATDASSLLITMANMITSGSITGLVLLRRTIARSLGLKHDDSGSMTRSNAHGEDRYSPFTAFLLSRCEPDSLLHSILMEKDSRRIAYFTCLNFAFMLVQGLYGYLSGSLGLLSDTVHMFFDCLGLIVGLGAAVASKWPRSPERPFGWAKLNTLAGFGNGIFLMLVSVEFAWEAVEGMLEGRELRRVKELLVVSTLGLLINLIGLFAFGHAHAGHDHSHGHSHSHAGPSHSHDSHKHTHEPTHNHDHDHAHDHDHPVGNGHVHANDNHHHGHVHGHSDEHNENMHGIFLHVAADAGGSLAVIISTALTLAKPWYLWDPLATIIIAVLIFAAAVPLVSASGRKLLLIMPDEAEHGIKSFLQEVAETRGALGYAAPRFWLNEKTEEHDHDHDHATPCAHLHTNPEPAIVGSLHVIAAPFADLDDVRERVQDLAASKGIRATVQVEYDTDSHCWCGGTQRS